MSRLEHVSLLMSRPPGVMLGWGPAARRRPMGIVESIESTGTAKEGARRLRVSSPVTRAPIGEITVTSAAEVRAAVGRARAAQPAWEAAGFDARAAVMRRALKILIQRQEDFIDA